jgi:hypothetical protein
MSCEVEGIVEQTKVAEESLGLETDCQLCPQLATPPSSPITLTAVLLSSNQEKVMSLYIVGFGLPSNGICCQR